MLRKHCASTDQPTTSSAPQNVGSILYAVLAARATPRHSAGGPRYFERKLDPSDVNVKLMTFSLACFTIEDGEEKEEGEEAEEEEDEDKEEEESVESLILLVFTHEEKCGNFSQTTITCD